MSRFVICVLTGLLSLISPVFAYSEWRQAYYTDDFGDIMYDKPYVETQLQGLNHSFQLHIRYMPVPIPAFELIIANGSNMVEAYGAFHTTAISIKDTYGNVTKIDVDPDNVVGGRIYLTGDGAAKFAGLIDNGNCKIIVRTQTYLDTARNPGNYLFSATTQTNGILSLIANMTPSAAYDDDEEFMSHSMGDFCGTYTLKGKIDGKYAVTMILTFDFGSVSGTYYYDKYRNKNKIDGYLANLGPMTLTEYDGNKKTGEYDGEFNGKVFRGEFVNYASGKRMPFLFTVQ